MARKIGMDGKAVYRARITRTGSDNSHTWYEGPYAKVGHARGRISFWRKYFANLGQTVVGGPEQAHTVWMAVPEDGAPVPAEYTTDVDGRPSYSYRAGFFGSLKVVADEIGDGAPGLFILTNSADTALPLDRLPARIARLQTIADTARTEAEGTHQ